MKLMTALAVKLESTAKKREQLGRDIVFNAQPVDLLTQRDQTTLRDALTARSAHMSHAMGLQALRRAYSARRVVPHELLVRQHVSAAILGCTCLLVAA